MGLFGWLHGGKAGSDAGDEAPKAGTEDAQAAQAAHEDESWEEVPAFLDVEDPDERRLVSLVASASS